MTDALWTRLATLVPEALDRPAPERAAFLDAACTGPDGRLDDALRAEAGSLVEAAERAEVSGTFRPITALFGDGGVAGLADAEHLPPGGLPERIGAWRIRGLLGEGGMGVVYRAARADGAFEREVALKRLRPGLGAGLADRLDAERRTLARLEHDGIARLYDGGVDESGVPFLVMECVDGLPLTEHAEAAGLDVAARVALVADVCAAVAYAHQNLVVHRDLKPSNVLVTPDGRPKLLDFGVAKLLDTADDGPGGSLTVAAVMTPAYAAPEQVRGEAVTTATDVYALGVLLYELLAGTRPYDLAGLTAAAAERVVCETDPPPPSAAAPAERARALRGDLDTVVATAMAKEPARRYPTADALAADLRRVLGGLPIEARPASRRYRARLFVRRHRAGVLAAAALVLTLVGGIAATAWQARAARLETARAEAVQEFLLGMLGAADPDQDGRDVRVADLLDRTAASLDSAFADQPAVRADAHLRLGRTYFDLGLLPESEAQLRRALALRERIAGPDARATAEAQHHLGTTLRTLGDYAAADSLYALALATLTRRAGPDAIETAVVLSEIGTLRFITGDGAAAAEAYRRVGAIEAATLPPDDPERLTTLGNLAAALTLQGETAEATALLERQVALYRTARAPGATGLANALANLGAAYARADRYADAARVQTEAVARFRRALGDAHPSTAFGLSNLGSSLTSLGRAAEAEPLLRESAAIYRAAQGADHPEVGFPLVNLAKALRDLGRLDEAEAAAREAARLFADGFGDGHWTEARVEETLASIAAARR